MAKNSVSESVAREMNETLNSESHKSLFGTIYKSAQQLEVKMCEKCHKNPCVCADVAKVEDAACANDGVDVAMSDDSSGDEDEDKTSTAALDVAIDSLIRASAALDRVGFEKSATVTLNLAGLVAEAKKKKMEKKKAPKKPAKSTEKSTKETPKSKSDKSKKETSKDTSKKTTEESAKKSKK